MDSTRLHESAIAAVLAHGQELEHATTPTGTVATRKRAQEAIRTYRKGPDTKEAARNSRFDEVDEVLLSGIDLKNADAIERIVEMIDAAEHDEAPLVTSGADLVEGVTLDDTPMLAPGLAYVGRAVLVHAQRDRGKTTLLAWLTSRATVDGNRVLIIGDDDSHSWKVRMVGFGADHKRWDYGRASLLAPAGKLERAIEAGNYDWIIVDNWRTWGLASGIPDKGGFGNTDAAAVPIQRLVDLTADGTAITVVANEGHHNQERSRDSIVVEDAVHAVRKVVMDEDNRMTTVKPGKKTWIGIDQNTRRWKLREEGDGMDLSDVAGGRGGDDGGGGGPRTVDAHSRRPAVRHDHGRRGGPHETPGGGLAQRSSARHSGPGDQYPRDGKAGRHQGPGRQMEGHRDPPGGVRPDPRNPTPGRTGRTRTHRVPKCVPTYRTGRTESRAASRCVPKRVPGRTGGAFAAQPAAPDGRSGTRRHGMRSATGRLGCPVGQPDRPPAAACRRNPRGGRRRRFARAVVRPRQAVLSYLREAPAILTGDVVPYVRTPPDHWRPAATAPPSGCGMAGRMGAGADQLHQTRSCCRS